MSTINIAGKNYEVELMSEGVKRLITIHGKWSTDVEDTRLELAKGEAALRDLSREIVDAISKETQAEIVVEATEESSVAEPDSQEVAASAVLAKVKKAKK